VEECKGSDEQIMKCTGYFSVSNEKIIDFKFKVTRGKIILT